MFKSNLRQPFGKIYRFRENTFRENIFTMRKKTGGNIFFFFIAIIVIAVMISYQIWNKLHQNVKSATGIETTAIKLYSNLTHDSASMKSKLPGKIIVVSGGIRQVLENQKEQQIFF